MKSSNPEKNQEALDKFLTPLEIVDFDYFATLEYGRIRAELEKNGTPIGPLDTLIAAHAKSLNLPLQCIFIKGQSPLIFLIFGNMNAKTNKISRLIRRYIDSVDPKAEVILYGSRARGEEHSESDWDILILTDYQ